MIFRKAIVVIGLSVAAAGCDEKLSDVAGPTPNLTPTFPASSGTSSRRQIRAAGRPVRRATIRTAAHSVRSDWISRPSGSYDSLVGVRSTQKGLQRVAAGDPENSYLLHKLEGRTDIIGARMPNRGPYLSEGQLAIIRRWIELGARRD